jgi:hypothetical protein
MNGNFCVRGLIIVFLIVLLSSALQSCGQPDLTMDEIVDRAGEAMAEVESLHFAMTVEGGPAYIDPEATLSIRGAEGDLLRPDRVQATLKVGAAGLAIIQLQAVGIGEEQFLTKPITGEWQRMPPGWGFDPTVLFDREIGIEAALAQAQWEEQLEDERLEQGESYHLRGNARGEDVAPLTAWMINAEEVQVEVWVEKEDFRVLQLRIEEPPKEADGHSTIWLLQFSAFDEPMTIERPQGF